MRRHVFSARKKKSTYSISKQSQHSASFTQRGGLTIWVGSEAVENCRTDGLTLEMVALPTSANATRRLTVMKRRPPSHRAKARRSDCMQIQMPINIAILNRMTHLGILDSIKVSG